MPSWFKKAPADPIEVIGDDVDQHSSDKEIPIDIKSKIESPPPHEELDESQAAERLRILRERALHDPNLPAEDLDAVDGALDAHDLEKENYLVEELIEDSPYPEVCLCPSISPRPRDCQFLSMRAIIVPFISFL